MRIDFPRRRYASVYYTLPKARFVNLVWVVLFLDTLVAVVLYATEIGLSESEEELRTHWLFATIAIDLVLLTCVKLLLSLVLSTRLERTCVHLSERPFDRKLYRTKTILHVFNVLVPLLALAYIVTKGVCIYAYQDGGSSLSSSDEVSDSMVALMAAFTALELLLSLLSPWAMKRVFVMVRDSANIHFLDGEGREVDESGRRLPPPSTNSLARLASLAAPEKWLIGVGTAALILASVSTMIFPLYFGKVVDSAIMSNEAGLSKYIGILTAVAALGSIFSIIRGWTFNLAGYRLVSRLRCQLFRAIVRQDVAFFDSSRVGELTSRLSSDTQVIQTSFTNNVAMVLRYALQILGSVAIMFYLCAPLTGVLLAVVPAVAVGAARYGRFFATEVKRFQEALGVANTTAEESLGNIRTIRSFACDEKTCSKYECDINKSLNIGKKLAFVFGLFQGLIIFLVQGALVLVLWYGGKLVLENAKDPSKGISVGTLGSFIVYALNVALAFAFLSSIFGELMKAVGASQRIFELMDRQPVIKEDGILQIPDNVFQPKIQFDNVSFCYASRPDKNVLSNVSFVVQPGQTVALVGPSGGGKTTCINLLLHLYTPTGGEIRVGGKPVDALDACWFRSKISVVSQEPILFGYSVADNIAFGRTATMDEIIDAARQANAHEFITRLEKGYDTLVGERGVRLSGGQKQRVAIARALIMNPRILLLDEATSALDSESEQIVKEAIDRAMVDRTVLVIAHRLSTVKNADMVLVVDDGIVSQRGTHAELYEQEGLYRCLVDHQQLSDVTPRTTGTTTSGGSTSRSSKATTSSSSQSAQPIPNGDVSLIDPDAVPVEGGARSRGDTALLEVASDDNLVGSLRKLSVDARSVDC